MSEENGLDPAWEALTPVELPPYDELMTDDYLEGQIDDDPTGWIEEGPTESELGNDPTQYGLKTHARITGYDGLPLGTLLQTGWTWGYRDIESYTMTKDTLDWLRPRLVKKINATYYHRDLGTQPVGKWVHLFHMRLAEILDRLGPLYEEVRQGLDILDKGIDQSKSIDVNSEFPQARLKVAQEDYASNSNERAVESVGKHAQLDRMVQYNTQYMELDKQVIDYLSPCFSSFVNDSTF